MHHDIKPIAKRFLQLGCRLEEKRKHVAVIDPDGRQITVIGHGGRPGPELVKKMWKRVRDLERRVT